MIDEKELDRLQSIVEGVDKTLYETMNVRMKELKEVLDKCFELLMEIKEENKLKL